MKELTETGILKTSIVAKEESKEHIYEICRDMSNGEISEGEEGLLITIFPATNDVHQLDMSTYHTLVHSKELGIKRWRFLYLFSRVSQTRMSTRSLVVDEENLRYLEFALEKYKSAKVVIAYGNSMSRCSAAIESKRRLWDAIRRIRGDEVIWQIGIKGKENKENLHPLYAGIMGSHGWILEPFKETEQNQSEEREDKKIKVVSKESGRKTKNSVK